MSSLRKTLEVSGVQTRKIELPPFPKLDLSKLLQDLPSFQKTGFYYGITPDSLKEKRAPQKKRLDMRDTVSETLNELRTMRQEMEAMRHEMHEMKRQMVGDDENDEQARDDGGVDHQERTRSSLMARHKRQRHFEKIGDEVERWAEELLFQQDGVEDGWAEVQANKVLGFNRDGRTKAYLKWMKDSRGKHADPSDERKYPCIKMYSTIDAPLEDVCLYLSQKANCEDYNDLMERIGELEEITPHSKICWSHSYQILFLKPRLFTAFCSHRWLRDGTEVVVNQAVDHPDTPGKNKLPLAYAIRGANFISRDPDDPEKTRIAMLSHGNPGKDVPAWAVKTAVNTLVPIEPFKLFHKLNKSIQRCRPELERRLEEIEMVSAPGGRTSRPAGLAQLGYACFWPQGGGVEEDLLHRSHPGHSGDPVESTHNESTEEVLGPNDTYEQQQQQQQQQQQHSQQPHSQQQPQQPSDVVPESTAISVPTV
jgi:hypothetical protein